MLLKSVKLCNIRSYESSEINFPSGSTLLAGDIGAGKSTILLAIEFALFGAKKGELPGYTLLRHGKKEGSVELKMSIEEKEVIIKRVLKKSLNDIKQEAGYIIINGHKKDATSEELRSIVLDLLGYPKDLVKKGRDWIYRYTVYTPQEEMKHILYESTEARLDTLRKVFNIDKYKKIRDNSRVITNALREKKRGIEGFIHDLEYKKKDLEDRKKEIAELNIKISGLIPKINEIKNTIARKRASVEEAEKEVKELNFLKKEFSIADATLSQKIEQNNKVNEEIKKIDVQIGHLKKDIEGKSMDNLPHVIKKIEEKEKEITVADEKYKNIFGAIRDLGVKIEHCHEAMHKIQSLDVCAFCEQKVDGKHRQNILTREKEKCEKLLERIKQHKNKEESFEKVKQLLKKELDALIQEEKAYTILKMKLENMQDKTRTKDEKLKHKEQIKKDIGLLNKSKANLNAKLAGYADAEEKYQKVKKEIDDLLPQERFLELEKRRYDSELESTKRFIAGIEREILEKQKAKEKLAYIAQLGNWIDEFFINLMSTMEKHIMVSINLQFNEMFRKWFDILIEDETINVGIDETFTPIVEQNGYETFIENLSGGEKTSVALSYRLALNKVVNDIAVGVKTKDIIILDEPTDGFSNEQLDKVRDVLDQLGMSQIIIVSHESKIESFVQNIIRVQKQDHVSFVA